MYIVNHFLDVDIFGVLIPDTLALGKTNAPTGKGSIGAQADLCTSTWGRKPNVILVDYFDAGEFEVATHLVLTNYYEGDVFKAQDTLNGL